MIKKQRESGLPLLIFAPEIRLGEKLCQDLQSSFPHEEIAFVASTSLERLESVERFRHGKVFYPCLNDYFRTWRNLP